MTSNFYIWTLNNGKRSACSYYRIEVPMVQLNAMNLAEIYEENGLGKHEISNTAMLHSDVCHWYAVSGESFFHKFKSLRGVKPGVREGHEIHPPCIIYDTDDNVDFTHPFNPMYSRLGVRGYPDIHFLNPATDEGVKIADGNGNVIAEWVDKETFYEGVTFDIERNLHDMKVRHEIIRQAHGVTVASQNLARYMRDVVGQKNTYFFPNTIVPEHYSDIRAVRKDPDKIRILWQGGMSHWVDWYPLREALKTLAQKYPDLIKFVIFGEWFNWIHDTIPDHMVEHHPWVPYDGYHIKRMLLNCDINLCPLVDNIFNSGKSAIKWYEASFSEQPEATLAAKTGPYLEIQDGETGLLYSTPAEFVEKLSLLIEDASLRNRVATGARQWVLENRTPKATIPGLFDFYAETRARQRRDLGKPIIARPTLEEIKKVGVALR